MDKRFLHKVVDQIVSETEIDYDNKLIDGPFFHSRPITVFRFLSTISLPGSFYKHCRDVYGLNEQEIEYVWEEYRYIILYKIEK